MGPREIWMRGEARIAALPDWLGPWILLALGIGLAVAAQSFIWRALRRLARGHGEVPRRLVHRTRKPARLFAVFVALALLIDGTALPEGWREGLGHLAGVILIVIVGWMAMLAVDLFVRHSTAGLSLEADDNLAARKIITQMRVLRRTAKVLIVILTVAAALSTFEAVRAYGVSLFASAGAAGLVVGLAARPVLSNLIAGLQIALTQPIRIDDVVIVEGEWGRIEEIAATYVVIKLWDLRRLVVPLSYFIEQPFQNWTRQSATVIGNVVWHLDPAVPMGPLRQKAEALVRGHPLWDGKTVVVQVVETSPDSIQVRALMSADRKSVV